MRLIDDGDERLFQTVIVAARLGRSDKIIDALAADYDDRWDDPEAIFRYALGQIVMIQTCTGELQRRASYTNALGALDEVLESEPEHWLARYCRARHRILVRTGYGRYQQYLDDERAEAEEDLHLLLDGQEQQPWQPYFASTLMLAAQFHAGRGELVEAAEIVAQAAECPREPVPFVALKAILVEPFKILQAGQLPSEAKDTVAVLMAAAFPARPVVRATTSPPPSPSGPPPLPGAGAGD